MGLTDISRACRRSRERRAGRRAAARCTLIAVSKVQPLDRVLAVLDAGHRLFRRKLRAGGRGEMARSARPLRPGGRAHDRPAADQQGQAGGRPVRRHPHRWTGRRWPKSWRSWRRRAAPAPTLFVQVNTGAEPQKAGVLPGDCRCLPRRLPGDGPAPGRPDVHPARRRGLHAAFPRAWPAWPRATGCPACRWA